MRQGHKSEEKVEDILISLKDPLIITSYFLEIFEDGCIILFAMSPLLVNNNSPDVSKSSLPILIHFPFISGNLSNTVFLLALSLDVTISPQGLW